MDIIIGLVDAVSDVGMVLGPNVGYIAQTRTMIVKKRADGFSTYVSFILIVSNLIRIYWWYVDRFNPVILMAAVLQVIC